MTNSDWNNSQQCPQSKRGHIFVYFGQIYLSTKSYQPKLIPLPVSNNLPAIEIQFGQSNELENPFVCHLDSCAGINTGSLILHQWIITTFPYIVKS